MSIESSLKQAETLPNSVFDEVSEKELFDSIERATDANGIDAPEPGENPGETPGGGQPGNIQQPVNPGQPGGGQPGNIQQPVNPGQPGSGQPVGLDKVISGQTAVKIVDTLFPLLFVVILRFAFNKKIKRSELQLTADERKTMEPVTLACLAEMKINFSNPFVQFFTLAGILYGSKAAEMGVDSLFESEKETVKTKAGQKKASAGKRGGGRHKDSCAWQNGGECNCRI